MTCICTCACLLAGLRAALTSAHVQYILAMSLLSWFLLYTYCLSFLYFLVLCHIYLLVIVWYLDCCYFGHFNCNCYYVVDVVAVVVV